jgi:hypothetical protein
VDFAPSPKEQTPEPASAPIPRVSVEPPRTPVTPRNRMEIEIPVRTTRSAASKPTSTPVEVSATQRLIEIAKGDSTPKKAAKELEKEEVDEDEFIAKVKKANSKKGTPSVSIRNCFEKIEI